jgi:uncharacterized protein YjbI with pentapeptide repeats
MPIKIFFSGRPAWAWPLTLDLETLVGADLSGQDLQWANLSGRDLTRANLSKCDLRHADLTRANLSYCDLRHTGLYHANLRDATLDGAHLAWCQHDLTGEILRQAAGDDPEKLTASEFVFANHGRAWEWFRTSGHPQLAWGCSVLAAWLKPGDDHAPAWLADYQAAP